MRLRWLKRIGWMLALAVALGTTTFSQGENYVVLHTFAVQSATGQTSTLDLMTDVYPRDVFADEHTIQLNVTGSPAGCTYELDGSLDKTNWFSLSGDVTCTSSTMMHVVDRPVAYVRGNLTALSGGSSPTVTLFYLGIRR